MPAHPVKKGMVKAVCVSTVRVQSVRGRVRSVLELGKAKRQPFYRARFVQRERLRRLRSGKEIQLVRFRSMGR